MDNEIPYCIGVNGDWYLAAAKDQARAISL
jgi:hypothetical protein